MFREGLGLVRERGEAEGAEANVLKGRACLVDIFVGCLKLLFPVDKSIMQWLRCTTEL